MKIQIVGMGPGSREYLTFRGAAALAEAEVLCGAKRLIESLAGEPDFAGKEFLVYTGDTPAFAKALAAYRQKRCTVCVSGDTGFYSLAHALSAYFEPDQVEWIPGISTFAYFFAKLGMSYENFHFLSAHGRSCDITGALRIHKKIYLLTDGYRGVIELLETLRENGYENARISLGSDLSLPTECIMQGNVAALTESIPREGSFVMAVEHE